MARSTREAIEELSAALAAGESDRLREVFADDVLLHGTVGGIYESRVWRGGDEAVAYFEEIGETWEEITAELGQIETEGDLGVAFYREIAQSSQSAVPLESETASVFRVRDGKVCELRGYLDRDEALRVFRSGAVT